MIRLVPVAFIVLSVVLVLAMLTYVSADSSSGVIILPTPSP